MPDDMVAVQVVSRGFGPAQLHFLADMLADIGPEVFQHFWSSNRPIEDAFREATGVELIEWTRGWAHGNVGPVDGGPMPAVATVGMVSLLMLIGLAIGIGRAAQRDGGAVQH